MTGLGAFRYARPGFSIIIVQPEEKEKGDCSAVPPLRPEPGKGTLGGGVPPSFGEEPRGVSGAGPG